MGWCLEIEGGRPLRGEVRVSGSKNAALPILFTTLLTPEECRFSNVPELKDVETTAELLSCFGSRVAREDHTFHVSTPHLASPTAPYELVRTMRASVLALGPMLARFGEARISLPGGCAIGARPVDMHLVGLRKMGAEIDIEEGFIVARARRLRGTVISFRRKTVTGTENLMMAATLADGTTVLENAAQEPEVVELAMCLRSMGAKISGDGTKKITIEGVSSLSGARYGVGGDRIEAGTFLCAAMATGGDVRLHGIAAEPLSNLLTKIGRAGCDVSMDRGCIRVNAEKPLRPVSITTHPFPGFPTDMQAQWMAAMLQAHGDARVTERVFENRFLHVAELRRLGAEIIEESSHTCLVRGRAHRLVGAPVMATDLRASACLVVAGLSAEGRTTVHRVYHLDRGYEKMETKLSALGANVARKMGPPESA